MLRRFAVPCTAAALLLMSMVAQSRAALDESAPTTDTGYAILVLEVQNCFACDLVRKHIQPAYARTPQSRDVPLRYLDLNAVDIGTLGVAAPVTTVPTIVLMREGREISRLAGYPGPAIFLQAVDTIFSENQ